MEEVIAEETDQEKEVALINKTSDTHLSIFEGDFADEKKEDDGANFWTKQERSRFIVKVFGILSIQLTVTAIASLLPFMS